MDTKFIEAYKYVMVVSKKVMDSQKKDVVIYMRGVKTSKKFMEMDEDSPSIGNKIRMQEYGKELTKMKRKKYRRKAIRARRVLDAPQ